MRSSTHQWLDESVTLSNTLAYVTHKIYTLATTTLRCFQFISLRLLLQLFLIASLIGAGGSNC